MENKETNQSKQVETYIGWAVLIIVLLGAFFVLRPFLSAAVLAGVLTFSLWPATRHLTKWLRGRRTLAALLMTLTITLLLVAPFVILGFNLAHDVKTLSTAAIKWSIDGPHPAPQWLEKIPVVGSQAKKSWNEAANEATTLIRKLTAATQESAPSPSQNEPVAPPPANVESRLMQTIGGLIGEAKSLLLNAALMTGYGILQIVLSLLLMFFFLCNASLGESFTGAVLRIAGGRGNRLLKVAGDTVRSVIYGILGTAIVQGVAAGVGFAIAGVPGPVFLGLVTFFLSPVPVGPPLVWVPAAIWLFAQGHTGWGIFMLIWGFGVSSIDNVVKPWLISQGSKMPFLLIFIGVIGGALAFGFIGIFLGPSLLAVTYCLVDEWLANK